MPKYSVLIPVYNCEKYLAECFDSVLAQTYPDFELIAVDDGSSDGSGKICDEYARKDKRIKVIHKQNEGVFRARKTAYENSTGEYILSVDSDDLIESDLIETVDIAIKECGCDLVLFDHDRFGEDFSKRDVRNLLDEDRLFESNGKKELYIILLQQRMNSVVLKCCTREIYASGFDEEKFLDVSHGEDWFCSAKIIHLATKVKYIKKAMYHYRRINTGLSSSYDVQSLILNSEAIQQVLKMLESDGCLDNETELEWRAYCRKVINTFLFSLSASSMSQKQKLCAVKSIENTDIFKISVSANADFGSKKFTIIKFRLLKYKMYRLLLALMKIKQ